MAHIAFVIPSLRGGGAERVVLNLARGLCERGHKVDLAMFSPTIAYPLELPREASIFVLCGRKKWNERTATRWPESVLWWNDRASPFKALASLPGCTLQCYGDRKFRDAALSLAWYTLLRYHARDRALWLLAFIEHRSPDIVIPNVVHAEYAAFFAAMLAGQRPPVVPVVHNTEHSRKKRLNRRRRLLQASPHIVTVSDGVAENIRVIHELAADCITPIYNPAFTLDIACRAEEEPGHHWFRDDGPPVVLGVGSFGPQKDFPTLIDAFRRVLAERPCRLVILGEGPMRGELECRVRECGLEAHVSLPGWAENPFAFMARAALFVLSSRYEGFGNVLVEALACGCPAVSTDCPAGPAEILEDPALLSPVGDAEALAQVMLRALDRPTDKAALRAKAARFSIDQAVDGYERLVAGLLAGHRTGGLA